jgi:dTMP kinase
VKGLFIVLEGPEGSGKSTQLSRLAARLNQLGHTPVITREPGGTPAGDAIRQVLLNPSLDITPLAEFLLYSASRAQHVAEVIRPALAAGKLVISDRFYGASIAYQGHGRGLELPFIAELTERVTGGLKPDLTLLFDLEPQRGLARIAARGSKDRLEQADLAFHQRVREGFLRQARPDPSWIVLDATLPEEALAQAVWDCVEARLP